MRRSVASLREPNDSVLLADFTNGSIPSAEIVTDSGFPAASGRTYTYDSRGVQMALTGGTTGQYASFKWEPNAGTPGATIDLSGTDVLAVEIEVPEGTGAVYDTFIIYVVQQTGTSYTNYQNKTYLSGADKTPRRQIVTALLKADSWTLTNGGPTNFSTIGKIEFRFGVHASAQTLAGNIFVRKIWKGQNRTKVMLTFDDSMDGQINYAYPSLATAGFKATIFSSPSDVGGAGRLTEANYQTLYDAGWDMGLQQYNDSADIPVNYTGSSGLTNTGGIATWNNVSGIAHLLETGDSITVIGAMDANLNGTFTITKTGASTFTYPISGTPLSPDPGQPSCRRLTTAQIRTSFEDSRAWLKARGWTRGNNFIAYSNGVTDTTVETIVGDMGIVMARTTRTNAQAGLDPRSSDAKALLRMSGQTMDQQTSTTVLGVVDNAIKLGRSVMLYGHDIDPTPATLTITQSEWDLIVAGLLRRSQQGLIDVVTCTEFYNQLSSLRKS